METILELLPAFSEGKDLASEIYYLRQDINLLKDINNPTSLDIFESDLFQNLFFKYPKISDLSDIFRKGLFDSKSTLSTFIIHHAEKIIKEKQIKLDLILSNMPSNSKTL